MNSRNYQISWELTIAKASYCRSPWSVISRYFLAKKNTIPSSGESRYSVPSNLIKVNQMGQSSKSTCTKCEWIPQHGNLKANWLLPRFMLPKCGGHVGVAQGPKGSEISKTSPTPVELQILKKKLQKYIFFFTHDYIYISCFGVQFNQLFHHCHLFFTCFHCQPSNFPGIDHDGLCNCDAAQGSSTSPWLMKPLDHWTINDCSR